MTVDEPTAASGNVDTAALRESFTFGDVRAAADEIDALRAENARLTAERDFARRVLAEEPFEELWQRAEQRVQELEVQLANQIARRDRDADAYMETQNAAWAVQAENARLREAVHKVKALLPDSPPFGHVRVVDVWDALHDVCEHDCVTDRAAGPDSGDQPARESVFEVELQDGTGDVIEYVASSPGDAGRADVREGNWIHDFTEDVNDLSMCVCGIPDLTHAAVMAQRAAAVPAHNDSPADAQVENRENTSPSTPEAHRGEVSGAEPRSSVEWLERQPSSPGTTAVPAQEPAPAEHVESCCLSGHPRTSPSKLIEPCRATCSCPQRAEEPGGER